MFVSATSSLFWTEAHLKRFVPNPDENKTLEDLRPMIRQAEMDIARHISLQQLDALFARLRQSDFTEAQMNVVSMLRSVASALISVNTAPAPLPKPLALRYLRSIYEVMEDNPQDFAEYHASSVYAGRHAPIYENKPQDPLFALL